MALHVHGDNRLGFTSFMMTQPIELDWAFKSSWCISLPSIYYSAVYLNMAPGVNYNSHLLLSLGSFLRLWHSSNGSDPIQRLPRRDVFILYHQLTHQATCYVHLLPNRTNKLINWSLHRSFFFLLFLSWLKIVTSLLLRFQMCITNW